MLCKRRLRQSFILAALSLAVSAPALGADVTEAKDFTIHQHFVSPRALGMGNAFTAVADDYAALFYNPAGLARLEEGQMNFELRAMIDSGVTGFVNDIQKASGASSSENYEEVYNLLEKNYGKHYSARLPTLGWYWVRPRWGVAIIPVDLSLELEIHRTIGPAASLVATQDTTVAFGYGRDIKIKRGRLSWGANIKGIYRGYFNRAYTALDFAVEKDLLRPADAAEGLTVDSDIGLLFSPQVPERGFFKFARPTFGLTVRNAADYGFPTNFHLIDDHSKKPPRLQRRLDVGSMWELPDWWVFRSRFAFDVRDVGHENWTAKKGVHAGVEFLWKLYGWWQGGWRAGINQGYWTAGFTGKLAIFQLDLVSYGEEVGPSNAPMENRRYMAKASLDF